MPALLDRPESRIWTPERKRVWQPWHDRELCEVCNRRKIRCCCDDESSSSSSLSSASESEYSFSVTDDDCLTEALCPVKPVQWTVQAGAWTSKGGFNPDPWDDCCPMVDGSNIVLNGPFGSGGFQCQWLYADTCDPTSFTLRSSMTIFFFSGSTVSYQLYVGIEDGLGTTRAGAVWRRNGITGCLESITFTLAERINFINGCNDISDTASAFPS